MTTVWRTEHRQQFAPTLERAVGWLLGIYILVQFFGLPVLGVGPWALWPTLADLAFWAALVCALLYSCPVQAHLLPIWRAILVVDILAVGSALLLLVMRDGNLSVAINFGAFELYKLLQLSAVFWMVGRLRLTSELLARWERAAIVSYVLMVVTITATYFSGAIPKFLAHYLPHGLGRSGPWEAFYLHHERGLGTLGYNHAYVAALLLLLGTFLMMLRPQRSSMWVLLSLVIASFLSGARAGLVGALLFVVLEGLRVPLRSLVAILATGVSGLFAMPYFEDQINELVERQSTILNANDSENLAGRTDIWGTYLTNLTEDPFRLLLGSGLGSGWANNGSNAHMLILQVVYETGLVGLTVFIGLFALVFTQLRKVKTPAAQIFFNALLGLWASSLVEETFFPNSAFGSFLPMLMLVLVVALTPRRTNSQSEVQS